MTQPTQLLLHVAKNESVAQPAFTHAFDQTGGSIGRGQSNALVLPDPQRHISRVHAQVALHQGAFVMGNASSANSLTLNGRNIEPGKTAVLYPGDEVGIGSYSLRVELCVVAANGPGSHPTAHKKIVINDDLADEMTKPVELDAPHPWAYPGPAASSSKSASHEQISAFANLMDEPAPDSRNATSNQSRPWYQLSAAVAAAPVSAKDISIQAPPELVLNEPAVFAVYADPNSQSMEPAVASSVAAPINHAALWLAFCKGAGMSPTQAQTLDALELTPALMGLIGQALHHCIEGALKLMAIRRITQQSLHSTAVAMESLAHNPLESSADAGSAIAQLLQLGAKEPGRSADAVTQVMDHLVGYAVGTMSAMPAGLAGALKHFEPAQLEALWADSQTTSEPPQSQASLWPLYVQQHAALERQAAARFHDLFSKAFAQAYAEQIAQIHKYRGEKI
jgi:FHA domain-containing protein